MKRPLLILFLLELAYWLPARLLGWYFHGGDITKELLWTAIRLASAAAVYACFHQTLWPPVRIKARFSRLSLIAGGLVLLVPVLFYDYPLPYPLNLIFAATSLAVGLREEMVYRGVLQRILTERHGLWPALLVTNVIFVFYHFGAMAFTPWNVFQFFAMGTILGLLYHHTRSLLFVVAVHAAYDALICFTPFLSKTLPLWLGAVLLLAVISVLARKTGPGQAKIASPATPV